MFTNGLLRIASRRLPARRAANSRFSEDKHNTMACSTLRAARLQNAFTRQPPEAAGRHLPARKTGFRAEQNSSFRDAIRPVRACQTAGLAFPRRKCGPASPFSPAANQGRAALSSCFGKIAVAFFRHFYFTAIITRRLKGRIIIPTD